MRIMKFIDSEMMERYLRGESDAEESHKVLMWLMINLRSSSADSEFKELLEKVPVSEKAESKIQTWKPDGGRQKIRHERKA